MIVLVLILIQKMKLVAGDVESSIKSTGEISEDERKKIQMPSLFLYIKMVLNSLRWMAIR